MRANFDNASLEKAKLINANCTGATFRKANCYEAKFSKAKLTDCIFTECNLLWCSFKNAKGEVALDSFTGADVGYADFTKGCITSAHLMGARNVDKAKNIPPPKKMKKKTKDNDDKKENQSPNGGYTASSPKQGAVGGPPKRMRRQKSFGLIDPEMKQKINNPTSPEPKDYGNIDENTEQ